MHRQTTEERLDAAGIERIDLSQRDKCPEAHHVLNPETQRCIHLKAGTFRKLFLAKGMDFPWRTQDIPKIISFVASDPVLQEKLGKTMTMPDIDSHVERKNPMFYKRVSYHELYVSPVKTPIKLKVLYDKDLEKRIDHTFSFSIIKQLKSSWFEQSNDYIKSLPIHESMCLIYFVKYLDTFNAFAGRMNDAALNMDFDKFGVYNPFIVHGHISGHPLFTDYKMPYKIKNKHSSRWISLILKHKSLDEYRVHHLNGKRALVMNYALDVIDALIKRAPRTKDPLTLFDVQLYKDVTTPFHKGVFHNVMANPQYIMDGFEGFAYNIRRIHVASDVPALFIGPFTDMPFEMNVLFGRDTMLEVKNKKLSTIRNGQDKRIYMGDFVAARDG